MELSAATAHMPEQRRLLGLAVFQNAHQLEYVRSVHVFKEKGSIQATQQEFLMCSKGGSMTQMSPTTHIAGLSSEAAVKPYMVVLRQQHEKEDWKCLFDFCADPGNSISLPRNNHSRDPYSYTIPWFTIERLGETTAVNSSVLFAHVINAHKDPTNAWQWPPCVVPSAFSDDCVQSREKTDEQLDQHMGPLESPGSMLQKPQLVDLWQQWGSDLELASPRISQTFDLPLPKNNSMDVHRALGHNHLMPLDVTQEASRSSTRLVNDVVFPHVPFAASPRGSNSMADLSSLCGTIQTSPMSFTHALQYNQIDNWTWPPLTCEITPQAMRSMLHSPSSTDNKGSQAETDHPTDLTSMGFRKRKETPSAHKSNSLRASSSRLTDLTKDELSHYFNMPITQASKELKVGLTVLKKRCRVFGIPRWPHRKMKSLNSLIYNIKHLVKGDGEDDKEANCVQFAVEELEKQRKEMHDSPAIQLPERTKRLRQACFKASYRKRRQALDEHHMNVNHINSNSSSSSSSSNNNNNNSSSSSSLALCG